MKNMRAFIFLFIFLCSCSSSYQRNPANIFDRDDRITLNPKEFSGVGRLMKDIERTHSWGTAFHISPCHIVSAYHVVKDTELEMSKNDQAFFLSPLKEYPLTATPLAWGTPFDGGELNDNDWVIMGLSECVEDANLEVFKLMKYDSSQDLRGMKIQLVGYPEDRHPQNIHLDKHCQIGAENPTPGDGVGHNCATRPGNSGGPLFKQNALGQKEVVAIAVASRGYFVEIIAGYSPWIANTATPSLRFYEEYERIISGTK